jgi:cell division protein FtsX
MHDLDTRLERLAAEATRDAVPPEPTTIARRGRRRRRRQLAGSALVVAAVVAAGLVLPARLAGRSGDIPAAAPSTDVRGAVRVGGYWFGKTDATVLLGGGATPAERESVRRRLQALGVVDQVYYESKAEAYARMREKFRTKPEVLRNMTITVSGMADGFRVRLDAPEDYQKLQRALCPRSATRHGFCLDRVEVVEDRALLESLLLPEPWATTSWATSTDLSVFLPTGATDAGREAVRARLEAVDGVARVTYESPAEAYRRLPERLRRDVADPATPIPRYSPETMPGAFRVALDDPARAEEVHLALCGSRTTGACGGLVVWEHPRR